MVVEGPGDLQDLLLLLELLLLGAVLSKLHYGPGSVFNIIEANSPPKKLPDGHSLTLVCKILNVNFFEPQSRTNTSSFWPLRVLRTKLRAVSISNHTVVCTAAMASIETMTSERYR